MPRAVIFDLDGTLLDTIDDLAAAMNLALADHGYEPIPARLVRERVGWGLRRLVALSAPEHAVEDPGVMDSIFSATQAAYRAQPVVHTRPYPGVVGVLADLIAASRPVAILSNKPDDQTQVVVERVLVPAVTARLGAMGADAGAMGADAAVFRHVQGLRDDAPAKPDPASTLSIIRGLETVPDDVYFVGDSEVDIETARNAGCPSIGVTWGFRDAGIVEAAGPDHLCSDYVELRRLLGLAELRMEDA